MKQLRRKQKGAISPTCSRTHPPRKSAFPRGVGMATRRLGAIATE